MGIFDAAKEYERQTGGIFNFFQPWLQETKQEVTQMYIEGKITKEEFIQRMKNAI